MHGRYKELLQVQGVKASLLKAAHGIDQQRALAVRAFLTFSSWLALGPCVHTYHPIVSID